MKILLIQSTPFLPTRSGADKSNRLLLENLANRHHECLTIVPAVNQDSEAGLDNFIEELKNNGINDFSFTDEEIICRLNNVRVHAVKNAGLLVHNAMQLIKCEQPDFIFIPTDDFAQKILGRVVKEAAGKVICLVRTTITLPFGPDAGIPIPQNVPLFRKVKGIIAVSHFVKDYIYKWTGITAEVLPISLYGTGPFPVLGSYNNKYVTMFNPCAYKGIDIFLELVKSFPEIEFAAVPLWGTTEPDMHKLKSFPNITILEPVENVDLIYKMTRVLLVPSIWAEAKARAIGEALLRGIPVLASDTGGNKEAMAGLDFLLPVRPIQKYQTKLDSRRLPIAEVPEQDSEPWKKALKQLLDNKTFYEELAAESPRRLYEILVKNNGVEKVEEYLLQLIADKDQVCETANPPVMEEKINSPKITSQIGKLTPDQRAILLAKFKKSKVMNK